jgi:hypothetical protein
MSTPGIVLSLCVARALPLALGACGLGPKHTCTLRSFSPACCVYHYALLKDSSLVQSIVRVRAFRFCIVYDRSLMGVASDSYPHAIQPLYYPL